MEPLIEPQLPADKTEERKYIINKTDWESVKSS